MFRLACAAPNCLMRTFDFTKEQSKLVENNYAISFHKFPRDEKHRLAWIAQAKKTDWNPSLDESLCSIHFGDDCFDPTSQFLYDHAVPTIFFDDFRSYIKNLAKAINLEVDLESSDENEDILSKSLKSIGSLASDDTDDGDQIVECEISLSDDDEDEEATTVTADSEKDDCESTNSQSTVAETVEEKPVDEIEKPPPPLKPTRQLNDVAEGVVPLPTSSNATNTTDIATPKNSLVMDKLFSLIQNGSLEKNPIVEPTSKDFVLQLLNIVKMANLQNASIDSSVPNTYLITTRQEKTDADQESCVTSMETSDIISLITRSVKMIKKGEYHKSNLLTIICASPAIFLIKNVAVKSFDANMNSVYVVTSENLIKPLAQLTASREKEKLKKLIKPPLSMPSPTFVQVTKTTAPGYHRIGPLNKTPPQSLPNKTPPQSLPNKTPPQSLPNKTPSQSQPIATPPQSQPKRLSDPLKPVSNSTPLPPLKPKILRTNSLNDDTNDSRNVKIDIKTVKANTTIAQALKNLNLTGVPTLLRGVSSTNQNVLQLDISSPLPKVLIPNSKSNMVRLNLTKPIAVPKSVVLRAENSNKDLNSSKPIADVNENNLTEHITEDMETRPPPAKKPAVDPAAYLKYQQREIQRLESGVLAHEREIGLLRKKLIMLKKRYLAVKNPNDTKMDEHIAEDILNKYLDQDAVQFFISQMKVSGKTYTQFRWSEDDKLFALGLLYKHPTEYNILFQKFTLPSDKTLSKFVSKIKKAERDVKKEKS